MKIYVENIKFMSTIKGSTAALIECDKVVILEGEPKPEADIHKELLTQLNQEKEKEEERQKKYRQ
jgi:hypothetical protein